MKQLDLLVAELVEAAVDDRLERRAFVVAHRAAEREHLVVARPPRRDRLPVAVGVGVRERGREAEPTGLDRRVQLRDHRRDLGLGRLALDRFLAHDVAADRAVPDEEARVHADVALEPAEVLARSVSQFHGTPCSSAARGMPSTCAIIRRR